MGKLHDTFRLTITTLSPLHIGTGVTLRQGYDYVVQGGNTWVIDSDALAEMLYNQDSREFDRMVQGAAADQLIQANEYRPDSALFRYMLKGQPRAKAKGSGVQEQIKDPWDCPYIPGSSLKGALRTALAWVGWMQRKLAFQAAQIDNNPKTAAQPLEKLVLAGKPPAPRLGPNYELLRALQVSDTDPDLDRHLRLLNVQVITGNKTASPIELEAIPKGVTFTASLTLDGFLRQNAAQLGWEKDQLDWITHIPRVVNVFTQNRLNAEIQRWQTTQDPIRSFYTTLTRVFNELNQRSEFLLQLGWGGGWDSKTFGTHLTDKPTEFYEVVKRFRQMDGKQTFKKGDRYPKSRRVVVQGEQAVSPLGWIKVQMERV